MSLTAGVPLSKTVDSKPRLVNVDSTVNCIEKNVRHSRQRAMVTGGGDVVVKREKARPGCNGGRSGFQDMEDARQSTRLARRVEFVNLICAI